MEPPHTQLEEVISGLHRNNFVYFNALSEVPMPDSVQQKAFIQLALAYQHCHVDLMLREAVHTSQEVWDTSLKERRVDDYGPLDIYAACMYHSIQEFGRRLLGYEWESQESPARLPLERIRQRALAQKLVGELVFVMRVEESIYPPQEMILIVQEVLGVILKEDIEAINIQQFVAPFQLTLARLYGSLNLIAQCAEHTELARKSYAGISEHDGLLWAQYISALYSMGQSGLEGTTRLQDIASQFYQMGDCRGFLSCQMEIAKRLQKRRQNVEYHSAVISALEIVIKTSITSRFSIKSSNHLGSALAFWQYYMGMMTHDMEHFQFVGTVLELCTRFFAAHPKCSIPELKFTLASELSTLYGERLSDGDNELKWAAKAIDFAKETGDQEVIEEAQRQFKIILSGESIVPANDRYGFYLEEWREASRRDLELEFDAAGAEGRWEDRLAYAGQRLNLQLLQQLKDGKEIDGEPWSSKARSVLEYMPDKEVRKDRYAIIDVNIAGTLFESGNLTRAADMLQGVIGTDLPTKPSLRRQIYFMLGRIELQIYKETGEEEHVFESRKLLESVAKSSQEEGRPDMAACCYCILADSWMAVEPVSQASALRALQNIERAVSVWDTERDGIWNLDGLDGLLTRFSLRQRNEGGPVDVFGIAYRACFASCDFESAWNWAQKAKARGFIHSLEGYRTRHASDTFSKTLNLVEMALVHSKESRMGFGWLPAEERPVFVEWVSAGNVIYMLTARDDERPTMHQLNISLEAVSQWYLDLTNSKDDLRDAEEAQETLAELAALCAPLKDVTRPGELLVLCATKVLSKIPLHALEVDDDVLLARNPVTYTYAVPVLGLCFRRSSEKVYQTEEIKLSLFGNPTGNTPGGEKAVQAIGAIKTKAEIFTRQDATKTSFLAACGTSQFVHYHGHVTMRPQGHSMIFNDSALSATEVFAQNLLRTSPIVIVVGCGSGSEKVRLGDEPLGLVSSFIYAGASAVLATLWPIHDTLSGEQFSRYVIEKIGEGNGRVNLARILQRAALEIRSREETQAPYYWAGYVLHGCWLFEI